MTPATTDLLVNLGLVLAGALLRGHAPKLWNFLAPIFGASQTPAAPPSLPVIVGSVPATNPVMQFAGKPYPRIYQPEGEQPPSGPETPKG